MVVGPLPVFVQDKPNHVLVDAFSQEYCSGAERTFTEALLRLVS
jgi:hypothetical protein